MHTVLVVLGIIILGVGLFGFFRGLLLPPRKDPPDPDSDSIIGSSGGPPLS
jgi:hypothetical protein